MATRRERRRRLRGQRLLRPLTAALLSGVLPGVGQLYAGRRVRGLLLVLTVLATLTALPTTAPGWVALFAQTDTRTILTASGLVALARTIVVVDAYTAARASPAPVRRRRRAPDVPAWQRRLGLAGVLIGVLLPQAAILVVADRIDTTLDRVASRPTITEPNDSPTGTGHAGGDPASASTSSSRHDRLAPADGIIDVALIGVDAGDGRRGARADAIILLRLDAGTGDSALIGVPRNLVRMPLPPDTTERDCACFPAPLFALYQHGRTHPDRFPGPGDPGGHAVEASIERLLGLQVEHHVVVDMAGFVDAVDAIGGVTVDVDTPVRDRKGSPHTIADRTSIDLPVGRHHLDGLEALTYVRSRWQTDDYERMRRQRCLVSDVLAAVDVADVGRLLDVVADHVTTSVSRHQLGGLVAAAAEIASPRVMGLVPPDFVSERVDGFPVADRRSMRQAVANALPSTTPAHADSGHPPPTGSC